MVVEIRHVIGDAEFKTVLFLIFDMPVHVIAVATHTHRYLVVVVAVHIKILECVLAQHEAVYYLSLRYF